MSAVSVQEISYTYPSGTRALDAVSFEIARGSSTAILGSNGAGKSTLLDLILGYKQAHTITLFGKLLSSYGRKELGRTVALVPQSEQFNFSFTLLDYVLFGRSPHLSQLATPTAQDAMIAYSALSEVGLTAYADRAVTTLSGGEHQLVLLARAIAQESEILLLDEPTSALDPANRKRVLSLLKGLHQRGKTLLFTTHDANLAWELATDVVMLKEGRLLASGPKEMVVNSELLTTLYDTVLTVGSIDGQTLIW